MLVLSSLDLFLNVQEISQFFGDPTLRSYRRSNVILRLVYEFYVSIFLNFLAEDAVLMPSSQASLHTLTYTQPGSHYVQLYASARNAALEVAPYESLFDRGFVHQVGL